MEKLIHKTSREYYEQYAIIAGGNKHLREIAMELIGNDVEALREAYIEDKNLNNIDKVLKKAGTFATLTSFKEKVTVSDIVGKSKRGNNSYQRLRNAMKEDFKRRCIENDCSTRLVEILDRGGYPQGSWFLTFDLKFPEFVNHTREGRKKYSEISGKKNLGVSPACVVSGFKHIMIYDILGCEFVEE